MRALIKSAFLAFILIFIVAPASYIVFWPVGAEINTWTIPEAPKAEGILAPNNILSSAEPFGPQLPAAGPEDITIDNEGNFYVGLQNGQIIRINHDGNSFEVYAEVGGRPLGLDFDKQGNLYVGNADKGLQVISKTREVKTVATEANGKPLKWCNEVKIADDGIVYFTDSSYKYSRKDGIAFAFWDATGRLIAYNPKTAETRELTGNLRFANGLSLGFDQTFILVDDSGTNRILVHWLKGPKAGQTEVFANHLPGLPDNIERGSNGLYWVAFYRGADWMRLWSRPYYSQMLFKLQRMAWSPFVNTLLLGIPKILSEYILSSKSSIAAVNGDGQIVKYFDDDKAVFANLYISCAFEKDGWLYIGNLGSKHIYRLKLN